MRPLPLAVVVMAMGCSGNRARTPEVVVTDLRSNPSSFHPGSTVTLHPTFATGEGRIDPDVGVVLSGGSYVVGPKTEDVTYTLTVRRGNETERKALVVPFGYRERITELTPSPTARTNHGAVVLADGRVLLAGGSSPGPLLWASGETFTAGEGHVATGDLSAGRSQMAMIAWADGSATACAGQVNLASFEVATRIEHWDPVTRAWTTVGNLRCARLGHTTTALGDYGMLVVGGIATGGAASDRDAEVYVRGSGVRPPNGEMNFPRVAHTTTQTTAGVMLIAGGRAPDTGRLIETAETFALPLELFSPSATLQHPRASHAAVAIAGERILLIGGEDNSGVVAPTELFLVFLSRFVTTGSLTTPRVDAPAVLLADGRVLSAGGRTADGRASDVIEVWSPITETWAPWSTKLPAPRVGHSLHMLPDGRVLLLGGDPGSGLPEPTCWLID